MKWVKIDGVIERGISACCCPPDSRKGGQHTNSITRWYRIDATPWQKLECSNNTFNVLAGAAESCKEFLEAMEDFKPPQFIPE